MSGKLQNSKAHSSYEFKLRDTNYTRGFFISPNHAKPDRLGHLPPLTLRSLALVRLLRSFLQHLVTNQANFPINHPAWISRMEAKGVTSEEEREDVA